jgi:AcrR family transcriptional regulator
MDHPFPKSLRKRVEILKSAALAFRRQGYHGTSVDDIAQALRMTKGSLYYYFKNKEEILYVCHDYTLDLLLVRLKEIQASSKSPADKLRTVVITFVDLITEEMHGTAAVTLELEVLSAPLRRKLIAKRNRFDHAVRRIIREGIDQGVFRPVDPKFTTFAIMGAVNWIPRWFDPQGRSDPADIGAAFAEYLVDGLMRRSSVGSATIRTPHRRTSPADRAVVTAMPPRFKGTAKNG